MLGAIAGLDASLWCDWRLHGWCVAVELPAADQSRTGGCCCCAAGLTAARSPLPPLLDENSAGGFEAGLWPVRRGLCRQAFAEPENQCGAGPSRGRLAASTHARLGDSLAALPAAVVSPRAAAPLPAQPLQVLWGTTTRILRPPLKRAAIGPAGRARDGARRTAVHLPHLDQPNQVAAFLVKPEAANCQEGAGKTLPPGSHQGRESALATGAGWKNRLSSGVKLHDCLTGWNRWMRRSERTAAGR